MDKNERQSHFGPAFVSSMSLFGVQGKKKKEEGDGAIGKIYSFTDEEKDRWANLFDYMGSHENVRLKFARGSGPTPADTGRSRVEGDLLCTQFQKTLWGLEYCSAIFRNPRGSYERKDEYLMVNDWGFSTWSIAR